MNFFVVSKDLEDRFCVKSVFSLSAGTTQKDPFRGLGLGRQRTDLCYRR